VWFRSVRIVFSLIASALFFSPLQAQNIETQNVDPAARCLSGGILNGYRCKSDDPDFDDGVRYSVQLLQNQKNNETVFTEPLYHQTHLGGGRSFIYLGEYQTKDEAVAAAAELVAGNNLALAQWRPAIVEIDKSLSIPAIRLVQMYQNESYAYLAPKDPKPEQLVLSPQPNSPKPILANGPAASFQQFKSYFTIQLGSYVRGPTRLNFIRRNKNVGLLCRTKRNGQLAVYTGAYRDRSQAERRLAKLALKGYVLKLTDEDMLSCGEATSKILVYSKSSMVPAKQQVVAAANVSPAKSASVKISSGATPKNWEPGAREPFFTVQLAAFKTRQRERRFIDQHQQLNLLCRIRRNGKYAVYSGQFKQAAEAKRHMAALPLKQGYVLRLNGELLPACRG